MGLQINPPTTLEGVEGADGGDDWGTRIAKLIPAEALGLYGSAVAMVPPDAQTRQAALWVIVAVACALLILIRYRAVRDPATGRPQILAIAISAVSFFIWLYALGGPTSPYGPPQGMEFTGPLAAFLWGTMVPYFYRG
jgi:hypothetical protein